MATAPERPEVPPAPLRTQPSTFADRAAVMVAFFPDLVSYIAQSNDFTNEQAEAALAAAVAGNLSSLDLSALAGMVIGVNGAGDALEGVSVSSAGFATNTEALALALNTVIISPLRLGEVLEAEMPIQKIARKVANDDANIVFTEFDSTKYRDYKFVLRNVLPATDNQALRLYASADGGTTNTTVLRQAAETTYATLASSTGNAENETGASGEVKVFNFHEDLRAHTLVNVVYNSAAGTVLRRTDYYGLQKPTTDGVINHIEFKFASGNITSGEIELYGIIL